MTTKELVATLASPNGWYQDTASRLIYERQDKSAVPELVKLLETSPAPLGRLHAMCSLDGLGALKEENVLRALQDPEAGRARTCDQTFREIHQEFARAQKTLGQPDNHDRRSIAECAVSTGIYPRRIEKQRAAGGAQHDCEA